MPRFQTNRNGDDPESIRDSFRELHSSIFAVEEALTKIVAGALHGRNYQTMTFAGESRELDLQEVKEFRAKLEELKEWAADGYVRALPEEAQG